MIAKMKYLMFLILLLPSVVMAQRLQDRNSIAWTTSVNNINFSKRWALVLEYSWRRQHYFNEWQTSLARGGLQYNFKKDISVLAGYGYIIAYPYGSFPVGPYEIPEHRFFEQITWNEPHGRITLSHRFRVEQRLLAKVDQKATEYKVNGYNYVNRLRYLMRLSLPVSRTKMGPDTWYFAAQNEVFIGFGSNVNQNVFDQNRFAVMGGYQFKKAFKIEAGYLNHTLQQIGLVNSKQVYQYNNGILINIIYTKSAK